MTSKKNKSYEVKGLKRLFTIGKAFSYRDLFDRTKKYTIEAIGIFIVISFSFYVENKGVEYETTKSYQEMLLAFKKDMLETITNLDEYNNDVSENKEFYDELLTRWEKDNDSVFISKFTDEDGTFAFPTLQFFEDTFRKPISTRGYNVFKMGGVDFELMNNELSEKITKFYERDIANIVENTSIYDVEEINNYKDLVREKWIPELKNIDFSSNDFWIKNRRYFQNDFQLKWIVRGRAHVYEMILADMDSTKEELIKTLASVDSIYTKMTNDTYFIYWKINFD